MNLIRRLKNTAHLFLAVGANMLYFFPSRSLIVIGVTGTDGKTTTASLLYHILQSSGIKTALITTIGAVIDGINYDTGFHVTTPSPFAIQKYLKIARQKGCTHVVLEVTSHALDQNRVWGVHFTVGVLTNITHEHLDYHKDYQRYVEAKLRLFKRSEVSVINSNGEWFEKVRKIIPQEKLLTYSLHGTHENDTSLLTLPFKVKTKLIGEFNLENILAATVAGNALGVEYALIDRAVRDFEPPPGRQELLEKGGVRVIIDFAHTANSFEKVLPEIRKMTKGRLIHVFGAAGERDRKKRPEMGKAASFYDDIIILTSEDPRREDIKEINRSIKKGIHGFRAGENNTEDRKEIYEINNRKDAIEFALSLGQQHDTIIITGKGHEKSINYGHGEEEWSDRRVVTDYFQKKT